MLETNAPDVDGSASTEDSDDDANDPDPPVYQLTCKRCEGTLSLRGMNVFLIADPRCSLYSTDIPTEGSREVGRPTPIGTCECLIRRLECSGCGADVGYHVTRPCEGCLLAGNNGHYWLYTSVHACTRTRKSAEADEKALTWSQLAYNGSEEPEEPEEPEVAESGDARRSACPICFCPVRQRTIVLASCRHEFCFGCISREVDARGCCPLDRLPLTRSMLQRAPDPGVPAQAPALAP